MRINALSTLFKTQWKIFLCTQADVPTVLWPRVIESPYLGLPINNIGDGLNGGSEKVGAGCAELNSGYNARCRSFEMYGSCISPVTRQEGGGGKGRRGERTRGREARGGWIADERGWCRSDVVAGRASASTELDLSSVAINSERKR